MDYNLLLSDDISEERVIYDEKDYFGEFDGHPDGGEPDGCLK